MKVRFAVTAYAFSTESCADGSAIANGSLSNTAAACAASRYILTSRDGEVDWTNPTAVPATGPVAFPRGSVWVVLSDSSIVTTSNRGLTWSTPHPVPVPAGWRIVQADFVTAQTGWIVLANGLPSVGDILDELGTATAESLLGTSTGGVTWSALSLPLNS